MNPRIATVEEMKALWQYSQTPTYAYFVSSIENGNMEFWTIEGPEQGALIAELYIIWDAKDKDQANGIDRAYLCALRVRRDFRGQGLSSKLMQAVQERAKERGFRELTIGVDNREYEKLHRMYQAWGFTRRLKQLYVDEHGFDMQGKPIVEEEPFDLLLCTLD